MQNMIKFRLVLSVPFQFLMVNIQFISSSDLPQFKFGAMFRFVSSFLFIQNPSFTALIRFISILVTIRFLPCFLWKYLFIFFLFTFSSTEKLIGGERNALTLLGSFRKHYLFT